MVCIVLIIHVKYIVYIEPQFMIILNVRIKSVCKSIELIEKIKIKYYHLPF